jgi:hypothetical protein
MTFQNGVIASQPKNFMTSTDTRALEELKDLVLQQELLKSRLGQTLRRMDAAFPGLIKEVSCPEVDGLELSCEGATQDHANLNLPQPTLPRFQVP